MKLHPQDLATILAALRYYQENGQGEPANRSDAIHCIATQHDAVISLDSEGIDDLCERLNFEDAPPAREWVIMGPDGIPIHQEPYNSLDELAQAAANFPMRFLHAGFYRDSNGRHLDLADLPALLRVIESEPEPDDDDDDPAADPDPIDFCSNLHSPELETLIPAIIAAYESIRVDAQAAAAGNAPIAIVYDRIGNGEELTPFGYCPPSAVPVLHRHGTIVATCLP